MVSVFLLPKVIQAFGGNSESVRICAAAVEMRVLGGKWNVRGCPLRWQWMTVGWSVLGELLALLVVAVAVGSALSWGWPLGLVDASVGALFVPSLGAVVVSSGVWLIALLEVVVVGGLAASGTCCILLLRLRDRLRS